MDLSILIPTVPPRKKYLNRLLTNLQKQIVDNNLQDMVEIIIYEDDFEKSVGEKRNIMVDISEGKYIVIIDDDDMVSENYCLEVVKACQKYDVDQIVTNLKYFHNGNDKFSSFNISKKFKGYGLVFFNTFNFLITKYYKTKKWEFELEFSRFNLKSNSKIKKIFIMSLLFIFLIINRIQKKANIHCSHHIPMSRKIYEKYKFSNRPREQDIEWISNIFEDNAIKTEVFLHNVNYLYYFDEIMSINRGKWGHINKEEKMVKLLELSKTTKNFDWNFVTIDKINIKWI